MSMARAQGEELEPFMRTRYFPPGARPQVPTGHGAALRGEKHPCPGSPPPPARLPGPGGPEGRGEPRAPRRPHRPGPGSHPRLRSRGQRSPPARRGARPLRLPRGHRPPARRGATGRAGPGVGRPRRCAARGCSAAARPPVRPAPRGKAATGRGGAISAHGASGAGSARRRADWPRTGGPRDCTPNQAPPHCLAPGQHPRISRSRDSNPRSRNSIPAAAPGLGARPGCFWGDALQPGGETLCETGSEKFPPSVSTRLRFCHRPSVTASGIATWGKIPSAHCAEQN